MKGQHFRVLRKLFVAKDAGWVVIYSHNRACCAMLLFRHLYTSVHHEVKGLMKGTPSIHPHPWVRGELPYKSWAGLMTVVRVVL